MTRYWLGVVSRDHVRHAVDGGFCQANHGKEAPMKLLSKGDGILYYSPREAMGNGAPVKAFTAVGRIVDDAPYQIVLSERFKPFRRKTDYFDAKDAPIAPLLDTLSFSRGGKNWGLVLRRGFFAIEKADYEAVAEAAGVAGRLKP
jgi:uncharacterized protein YqjF (DUF2071 family)